MVIAILQARLSSSRFPGKVLAPIGGTPLLSHQWQRLKKAKNISHALVATSTDTSDDALATFCNNNQIPCFRGPLNDVLKRYALAFQFAQNHFSLNNLDLQNTWIIRLTGDCPLSDPDIIDRAISIAENGKADYVSNTLPATYPDGLDVEVFRASVLMDADQNARLPSEREHVTLYIKNNPRKFKLRNFTAPSDFSSIRLTVDHPEDLKAMESWLTHALPKECRSSIDFSWEKIVCVLQEKIIPEPVAALRNAGLDKSLREDPLQPLPLALGTVQWGKPYGITNMHGQPSDNEISKILFAAKKSNQNILDSAPDYGDAENKIGKLAAANDFFLITKTHFIQKEKITAADIKIVRERFEQSLRDSRRADCLAVLVHYAQDLKAEGGELLWEELEKWCERGLTGKIGCSIYNSSELKAIQNFPLQIIQAPLNILDQRQLIDGSLAGWKSRGTEIHLRSIFLQGILLQPPQQLPDFFSPIVPSLNKLHKTWSENGINPLSGCLQFIAQTKLADKAIVGAATSSEWEAILAANELLPQLKAVDYSPYACQIESILHPAHWPRKNA